MVSNINRVGPYPSIIVKEEEERLISKYVAVFKRIPSAMFLLIKVSKAVKNERMELEELLDGISFYKQ